MAFASHPHCFYITYWTNLIHNFAVTGYYLIFELEIKNVRIKRGNSLFWSERQQSF